MGAKMGSSTTPILKRALFFLFGNFRLVNGQEENISGNQVQSSKFKVQSSKFNSPTNSGLYLKSPYLPKAPLVASNSRPHNTLIRLFFNDLFFNNRIREFSMWGRIRATKGASRNKGWWRVKITILNVSPKRKATFL